ncbi:ATP-binding protein [Wukongibacter baidiensis]|uniref:sensor histidine kinase n=1 Tax=Wukongibacter baidiensis TaxID=1723361 RepID=UPI003D7F24DD
MDINRDHQDINKEISKQILLGIVSILLIPILLIIILMTEQMSYQKKIEGFMGNHTNGIAQVLANSINYLDTSGPNNEFSIKDLEWNKIFPSDTESFYILIDTKGELIYKSKGYGLDANHIKKIIDSDDYILEDNWYTEEFISAKSEITKDGQVLANLVILSKNVIMSSKHKQFQFFSMIVLLIGSIIWFKLLYKVYDSIISRYIWISDSYKKVNYEKKIYLEKYLRSEKLVTMGRFASGIAHEIGNPLSSIISSTQILKKYELNEKEKNDYYDKILNDSKKIDVLIKEFLDFRKYKDEAKIKVNINDIISESIDNISDNKKKDNVELIMDLSKNLPGIIADKDRICMAFTNIIQNAYQAIDGNGFIHIRTLKLEKGIRIRIRDSGHGVKEEDMEKIFDPFFTTKDVGNGFGLGLFICMQIIHSHNGTISVDSNYGEGTIFTIDLSLEKEEYGGEENANY